MSAPLVVVDTVVFVGAVLGSKSGADALVSRAVATGEVRLALSDDALRELVRVLGYPEVEAKIERPVRAFEVALAVGLMGTLYHPKRLDWPSLRDPKDGWVFDLAFEAGADFIITRDTHVLDAGRTLGFEVKTPPEVVHHLRQAD